MRSYVQIQGKGGDKYERKRRYFASVLVMLLTLLPEAKEVLKNVFFKLGITGKESVWIKKYGDV